MSDRYRAVATLVFVGAAVAGLTVGGAAQQGEVPRTGQLQGPDGFLYVLTEENDAALLRFEPGPAPAK